MREFTKLYPDEPYDDEIRSQPTRTHASFVGLNLGKTGISAWVEWSMWYDPQSYDDPVQECQVSDLYQQTVECYDDHTWRGPITRLHMRGWQRMITGPTVIAKEGE